jgi:hypothetical protein
MRVRTGSATSTTDLAGYLRRCRCIVGVVDDWTLDAGVQPGSLSPVHARIELEGYLRVWEAVQGVAIDRLDAGRSAPKDLIPGAPPHTN